MKNRIILILISIIGLVLLLLTPSCRNQPQEEQSYAGFSTAEVITLESLKQVDDYPLYTMRYTGDYETLSNLSLEDSPLKIGNSKITLPQWGCSLFATLWEGESLLYGRNFDWYFSPALLLFTNPPDGYASVSMVDIAYLFGEEKAAHLLDLPLSERTPLLQTPSWPFDGMNEKGLAIGMAAVPESDLPISPKAQTIDSLTIIREILDHAQNVEEAVSIIHSYNIDWGSGPALHYMIADSTGNAVLVEFFSGEIIEIYNQKPYLLATNHLRTNASTENSGCWRYDLIKEKLAETNGKLVAKGAMAILSEVSNGDQSYGTQWSVVYDIVNREIHVVINREYENNHIFTFYP
jgi:hypothetical protein